MNKIMNNYAFISLASCFIALSLGIHIFTKDTKNKLNRIFTIFCLYASFLGFCEYELRQAPDFTTARIFYLLISLYPMGAVFIVQYCIVFSKKYDTRKTIRLLQFFLIFGLGITIVNFIIEYYGGYPVKTYWGWSYFHHRDPLISLIRYIILFVVFSLTLYTIYLLAWTFSNSPEPLIQIQAKFMLVLLCICISVLMLFDNLFPLMFHLEIPELSLLSFMIFSLIISYAIKKYELFSLDLSKAAEKIFSSISDCLILTNIEGTIISVNEVLINLLNYQEKELIKKPFIFLLASEQNVKLFNYQFQLLSSKENGEFLTDIEIDFKTKTNENIKISLTASKIHDKNRTLIGIIYIGRNITKTRKIEKQLDEAIKSSQFKSKFMASMSHELRTPLNAILGFVDLLLEDYCGPLNTCQTNFLTDVKLSSKDLLELISRLLDLSKIEAEKLTLEKKEIQITSFLDHIYSILKPVCVKKDLDFTIENLAISEFIKADYLRLKEILLNLLDNAIKFTRKGGIILRVKEQKDYLEFYVIDTGIGIAEGDFSNIFNEFSKIQNPEIKDTQGMGLGLAITKQLVLLHGGQISFSSELGKGSTFTFTIPK